MSISATPSIASNLAGAGKVTPQSMPAQSGNAQQSASGGASEVSKLDMTLHADKANNSFAQNVMDNVYTEMDKMTVESGFGKANSPVDTYKTELAPKIDSISPMSKAAAENGPPESVKMLSRTFDHAIFMAMVNQVLSGVSDSSRTLIKQS